MRRAGSAAVMGAALALGLACGVSAQTKPKPRPGQQASTTQTQCGAYGGGIHCNGGSTAQQFGSQRVREFGVTGAGFAQNFAAARAASATAEAAGAAPAPVYSGRRHRITTYSDGSSATTTQYGRHSVTVYSDGRVQRCQLFGAQRICN